MTPRARKPAPSPKPVVTARVCSVCGLPWDDHGKRPTLEKCVELLKAALTAAAAQPWQVWNGPPYSITGIPTVIQSQSSGAS